tara:strand:- start:519 stop:1658 length:1140 start_codon:yes stop_codon:yes gene_type:complete
MARKIENSEFLKIMRESFEERTVASREVREKMTELDIAPTDWATIDTFKAGRGKWCFANTAAIQSVDTPVAPSTTKATAEVLDVAGDNLVPDKSEEFVPWGNFRDINAILKSNMFYPMVITGHSGNGKTFQVEQSCARLTKECVRVNFTVETDEDDLLGHYVLVDGKTVWQDGPVPTAMKRGAVLLLDEYDLASSKIMSLQAVLEGKPLFIKKINQYVYPKNGFNIVATANTKGKGSEDGRYIGTNIHNEAFLDRFPVTFEQPYATKSMEVKMIINHMRSVGKVDEDFAEKLVDWANITRNTFNEGAADEMIATRRLVHIVRAFAIFGDKMKAINLCINRFDDITRESFGDLYQKVDEGVAQIEEPVSPTDEEKEEVPF